MDFRNILQEIEKNDPEVYEKLSGRRQILKSFGSKVALAALPLALGSMFKKAYGKTTSDLEVSLNFALELEYFHYAFFRTANNTGGLIPAKDQAGFKVIETHDKAHIAFLQGLLGMMGSTAFVPRHYSHPTTNAPYVPAAYDFTMGGVYAPFSDYATFLMMASVFKDTGIRAYNGQLPVWTNNPVFAQLQQLSATEGRHAGFIRTLRRYTGAPETPAPWINNDIAPAVAFVPNYAGEGNTSQLSVVTTSLPGIGGNVPALSASAAFDEPMDATSVLKLINPFILP